MYNKTENLMEYHMALGNESFPRAAKCRKIAQQRAIYHMLITRSIPRMKSLIGREIKYKLTKSWWLYSISAFSWTCGQVSEIRKTRLIFTRL